MLLFLPRPAAHAAPVVAAPVQKEEAPKPKREPRANNQARKGPRKERGPKDGEAKDGENQVRERKPRDGDFWGWWKWLKNTVFYPY